MKFTIITNDQGRMDVAIKNGISHFMIDMEINGKLKRQPEGGNVITGHSRDDLIRASGFLGNIQHVELVCRINPLKNGGLDDLDFVLDQNVDAVMLPFFTETEEVEEFVAIVAGRASTVALVETKESLARLELISQIEGLDELYFGFNDLRRSLGLDNMFEIISGGIIDHVCAKAREAYKSFGFGGIGRPRAGLPIPPELILGEHVRQSSGRVLLSQSFFVEGESLKDFECGLSELHECWNMVNGYNQDELKVDRVKLRNAINTEFKRLR